MEENGKKKMTTTTRIATTRLNTGRVKAGVNHPDTTPKPLGGKRKTWNSTTAVVVAKQQQLQNRISDAATTTATTTTTAVSNSNHGIRSPIQALKKTRSEPVGVVSSTNEAQLIKANSENLSNITNSSSPQLTLCDSDQYDGNDSDNAQDQDVTVNVNTCGTEGVAEEEEEEEEVVVEDEVEAVEVRAEEKVINTISDNVDDHALDDEHEEKNEVVDSHDKDEHPEPHDQGSTSSSDKLNQLDLPKKNSIKNNTKKVLTPPTTNCNVGLTTAAKSIPSPHPSTTIAPTPTSTSTPTSTTAGCKPLSARSKSTFNSPTSTTKREALNEYYTETHSKLQTLADLIMWRDVAKTSFIFGFGTFMIISSSYAKDINFSLISASSYISLAYLVVVFLYKSFTSRGVTDREDWRRENYVWGEEEAVWLVKLVLPYINEFLLKLRGFFSGDPAVTMKVGVMLFVLARCGSSITVWKMLKLGFFGVFVIPKLCSSYSTLITAHAKFWAGRFRDAWESCSHKKALAFAIFTVVWNFSSVVARAWAAFMLLVAFRYYQQSLISGEFVEAEEQIGLQKRNVQRRQQLARNGCRVPTSLDQRKQKKTF